jgi:hypothetical protein
MILLRHTHDTFMDYTTDNRLDEHQINLLKYTLGGNVNEI